MLFSYMSNAQTPNLGTTEPFAVFTAAGAFNNDGNTVITGDIGTDEGAFNGFPPGVVIGTIHVADPVSAQAAIDVDALYSYLAGLSCGMVLGNTLGGGQILTPNIYCIGAATGLSGELILNGEGDPNARFIIQIDGALSTATFASVTLINGASICNVYWQINGAFDLGDGSSFAGTVVTNGAISLLEGSSLQGRALSRAGAIELHNNNITLPVPPVSAIISAVGDLTFCAGDSVILSGNIDGIWNTGDTSYNITVYASGDYFVTNSNDCGIAISNVISVTVAPDGEPPMISCPGDISLNCNESILPANTGFATAIDDCDQAPMVTYSDLVIPGICTFNEEIIRTWVASDMAGNETSCIQTITISDLINPMIICPPDITLECNDPITPGTAGTATATDNCTISPAINYMDVTSPGACDDAYEIFRTWTATDECDNTFLCDQRIEIIDSTLPSIGCPGPITITCTESLDPSITGEATATDNCDGLPDISFADVITPSGICPQNFTISRTWTAFDNCSNSSQCVQLITVIDNLAPQVICPINATVECSASILPAATGFATATDDCDANPIIDFEDVSNPGICADAYELIRTWTATDQCGNEGTCEQIIQVMDTTTPVIDCPLGVDINCAESIEPTNTGLPTATDNCDGVPEFNYSDILTPSGLCPQNYTISRTWTAFDNCQNSSDCVQLINVTDSTPPTVICPIDATVECAAIILPASTGFATATDDCDASPVLDYVDITMPGLCDDAYTITRTWSATDACDNVSMCDQIIEVTDNTLPSINCPGPITITCTESSDPSIAGEATATDNCDANLDISYTDVITPSGICPQNYTISRTWTAIDNCSNNSQCIQQITVADTTGPVIICPTDATVDCTASILPTETGFATATDDCDVNPVVDYIDMSIPGDCPEILTVIRTWTAVDACGNSDDCIQNIYMIDDEGPSILCPLDVSITCAIEIPPADVNGVIASDNCGIPIIIALVDVTIDQTCLNGFTILRTYQASDLCDNTSTCLQTIIVNDTIAPIIFCPPTVVVSCDTEVPVANPLVVNATDNCGNQVTLTHNGDLVSNFVCVNQYVINRNYQAIDNCGNSSSCTQTITVFDNVAPVVTCPATITVACAADVPPVNPGQLIASDNCGGIVEVILLTELVTGLNCENNFTLNRTFQAIDECNNTSVCTQLISVVDNIPPAITCPGSVSVECADQVSPEDILLVIGSDNCGGAVVTLQSELITNQTCENRFLLTRVYLATDDCGNTNTCLQIVSVSDVIPPVITFIEPQFFGANNGDTIEVQCYGQDPLWEIPTFSTNSVQAEDVCLGEVNVTYSKILLDAGNCLEDGYINLYRLEWTATDICGNRSTVHLLLKLVDNIPPVIQGIPDDITLDCDALLLKPIAVTALDECLCACIVVSNQSTPEPGCQNGVEITITWTATDECGNVTNETQNITLVDTVGPTIIVNHPDITGIASGTILEVECNEDGFPRFVQEMDIESVTGTNECGGDGIVVVLDTSITVSSDCTISGFLEERTFLWTVSDLCGNSSTFFFSVRMIDTAPPTWVGIPDTVCIGSPLLLGIEAQDNCDNPYTRYLDVPIPNPCGSGMATRRKYEATDECGNRTTASAIIIPNDQTPPIILFNNQDLLDMLPGETILATCDSFDGQYTSFGIEDIYVEGVCASIVSKTFTEQVLEYRDCTVDSIKAIVALIWTVTDECGNSASRSVIASIADNTPPVFDLFVPEMSIGCTDSIPVSHASDNCGEVTVIYSDTYYPTNCVYEYDLKRLVTATDDCGNSISLEQLIHVGSGAGPIFSGIDTIVCDTLDMPIVTAYDPCTGSVIDLTLKTDTLDVLCNDGLVIVRTWTAVDICGRSSTMTQTIIINDHTPPVITVPGTSHLFPFWNNQKKVVYVWQTAWLNKLNALNENSVVIVDDCDDQIVPDFNVDIIYAEDCEADGYYERRIYTWIAEDICGNADTLRITIDIVDDVPPVFLEFPYDITIYCEPLPDVPEVVVDDYAQTVSIVFTETILPGLEPGVIIVTRTWVATDICGNSSKHVQTITWIPDNNLACEIILPEEVECNSHEVLIHSNITGGSGIKSYTWEIVGEECFIQGGQGTPWVKIYVGWSPVKIILTITDSTECVSMCMTTLECIAGQIGIGEKPDDVIDNSINQDHTATSGQMKDGTKITAMDLYPNPASDAVNLKFTASGEVPFSVNISNVLGQTIYGNKMVSQPGINTQRIDLQSLVDGNYVVQIVTPQNVYTKNLVILTR